MFMQADPSVVGSSILSVLDRLAFEAVPENSPPIVKGNIGKHDIILAPTDT